MLEKKVIHFFKFLVPKALRGQNFRSEKSTNSSSKNNWKKKRAGAMLTVKQKKFKKNSKDPLQSFNF